MNYMFEIEFLKIIQFSLSFKYDGNSSFDCWYRV